ncbi:hypothetical protein PV336_16445 [Streptomyces sp. MI02-2A]|uniref:hypothetical protein n=1 Tax=Streptomyces sp. MI02-2A TaxID=3028688 RepID=UPI0029B7612D|nr:hypothetical protein [Streptomyces sp. MI02-2A]MDX3260808.1 hypothetical protein [Streptomyces sp. MI02-2A]
MSTLPEAAQQHDWVREILNGSAGHKRAAAELTRLGVETTESSVRRWRSSNQPDAKPLNTQPAEGWSEAVAENEELLRERVDSLTADNRRLFQQYSKAKQRGDEYIEAVYRAARDAAQFIGQTPVDPPVMDLRTRAEEVALWHLTDWQGGKRTETYDRGIMRDRIERFVKKANEITEIQRADHPVHHGVLLFTGDMVEGVSIFPGQVWELDGTLFEQMFDVADLMIWTIKQALNIYETVGVVAEWGNHGRLGKKGDGIKASDNVDRMVYNIVKERLANEDRITGFQTSGDWYQHFTIGNYRAMAIHGDEIKSFGGQLPAYGILRKANQWATGVIPTFRDLYIGHYHQSMQLQLANGGSVFMTGSPESDNVYAKEFVAAQGDPSQRINFVNPEKGRVTAEYRVWL